MSRRARSSAAGLTLIELAVTIAVVAALLRLAAPTAGTWLANVRLRTNAESILDAVNIARAEALRRNGRVMLSFPDASGVGSWQICPVPPGGIACDAMQPIITMRDGAEQGGNARIGASDDPNSTLAAALAAGLAPGAGLPGGIIFDGLGRPLQAAGWTNLARIDIRDTTIGTAERRLVVTLGAAGAGRMCDPSAPVTSPQAC